MMMLGFQLGGERYALDFAHVVEVVPLARLRPLLQAPAFVAGVLAYRGQLAPIIDLCRLVANREASDRLSTRIILVRHQTAARLFGLLAEQVSETLEIDDASFVSSGIRCDGAPYLGGIARGPEGFVQRLLVEHLLPPGVADWLSERNG